MELNKIDFNGEEIKLTNVYTNPKLNDYKIQGINSNKIKAVYGTDLNFKEIPEDRPYIYGSFVVTVDGKLAYKDLPGAFEVAGRNHFAGKGSLTDFWWLNALRSSCHALVLGAKSISIEEDYVGYCLDDELEKDRVKSGFEKIPMNIVVSTDATDIPLKHNIFTSKEVPSLISCAPDGLDFIEKGMNDYVVVGPFKKIEDVDVTAVKKAFSELYDKTVVILTGEGSSPDMKAFLKVLRVAGVEKLLIESPTYSHLLIKAELYDEGFFNMSCVYIGGSAISFGSFDEPFKAVYHPHTEVLSIALHSPHMLFFRHRFIYGVSTD